MIPNKTSHTAIRTTVASKREYRRAAAREGLRLSEWLRQQADRAVAAHAEDYAARSQGGGARAQVTAALAIDRRPGVEDADAEEACDFSGKAG